MLGVSSRLLPQLRRITLVALALAPPALAQDGDGASIEVRPRPIGSAARLVQARGATDPEQIPLPLEGLEKRPESAPRSAPPQPRGVGLRDVHVLSDAPPPAVATRSASAPTRSVAAGPIWSQADATGKCPRVVQTARWTGAATGTQTPQRIHCECTAGSVEPVRLSVEAATRIGTAEASRTCPGICGRVAWTGHWWTTVPGRMSVCQLRWPEPPPPLPVQPAPTPTSSSTASTTESAEDAARNEELELERLRQTYDLLRSKLPELQRLREEREERRRLEEEARKDVRGPSSLGAINLLEGLHVDPGVALQPSDVLQIDHQVYQDANPATGLFYFAPKRYDLHWDPVQQYGMTIIYGMAGGAAEEGEVYMSARFDVGADARELVVARKLLISYLLRHSEHGSARFRELRPLPLSATSDVELFGGAHNQFTVPPEKISVQGVSGLLSVVDVSWAIDIRRLLNVESLLRTDAGIHGTITFHAAGEEGLRRTVPLELSVASPQTFGRIPFEPGRGWQNRTYYPVELEHLHALVTAGKSRGSVRAGDPVVYSWDLGGTRVPPGARVRWDPTAVPAWLGQRALLLWATYAVDSSCEPCDDRVFDERFIPERPPTTPLRVTMGNVFEATGAHRVSVTVRSPFLDPQRDRIRVHPAVHFERDGQETQLAELFLTDREMRGAGVDEPLFEYSVEVTMRDGRSYRPERWTPSRDLDLLLGSAVLERLFGGLPGSETRPAVAP